MGPGWWSVVTSWRSDHTSLVSDTRLRQNCSRAGYCVPVRALETVAVVARICQPWDDTGEEEVHGQMA